MGQTKMDNPEKLATHVTQDEEKQNKKHNTICGGHHVQFSHSNTRLTFFLSLDIFPLIFLFEYSLSKV